MSLRYFIITRALSTTRSLVAPTLSAEYRSTRLWDTRFDCPLLNDTQRIRSINTKILSGAKLDNLETDLFVNIAATRDNDIAPLQEVSKLVRAIRRSLYAHIVIPSTHHAVCRLFLNSNKLGSLVSMLENRVEFGIFPDSFALNLLFDELLRQDKISFAARASALMMLQEEFGLNKISDLFALYSVSKYIENKTDFKNWNRRPIDHDRIFNELAEESEEQDDEVVNKEEQAEAAAKEEENEEEEEEDEDEEDAEYHRIPFLRNPYHDGHFDITSPRVTCGKTLSLLGMQFAQEGDDKLATRCKLLGSVLQGHWSEFDQLLRACVQSRYEVETDFKPLCRRYLDSLHDLDTQPGDNLQTISANLEKLTESSKELKLSELAEVEFNNIRENSEKKDITWLKESISKWSGMRMEFIRLTKEVGHRKKLIEEIKAKKRELKEKEEFLYFFDELKRKSLTKCDYK